MGKSAKKSATKVDAAPVAVIQSGKKGKRKAENEIEKAVSAKKQKVERDEAVFAKQKVKKKQPKKAASSSSDEDSDDSDSDSEPKVIKKTPVPAKGGSVVAKKSKVAASSDSSDSSDSESDDSDVKPVVKSVKGKVAVKKAPAKDSSSSEESDSDSSDEEEEKKVVSQPKKVQKKPAESSESSDDSSSDEDEKKKVVAQPKKAEKKPVESSDSSSDDSSSDEEEKDVKKVEKKPAESSDSCDDESSDEDVKNAVKTAPVAANKKKAASSDSSSDEEDSSSDSDDEPKAKKANGTPAVKPAAKQVKADSSSSEESSDDDDSDEPAKAQHQPVKKDTDVEMVDAEKSIPTFQKTPKTPATLPATGSKTIFMGNLSFKIKEEGVRAFFKDCGEVVDVRLSSTAEGKFRGFGRIEFATAEAAQKALKLHDQLLLDRPITLDLLRGREKFAFTPRDKSFQKGGRAQGQTAFVIGFDTSLGEEEIRSTLTNVFESCGKITRLSIPPNESGGVKRMAFIDFSDSNALNEALGKDGTVLDGGYYLTVQKAKPRGDSAGGSGVRFDRGGGRSGGRRGGGRDSGRFGGRGGRNSSGHFGGRGGRTAKPSVTAMASGKKNTFDDD